MRLTPLLALLIGACVCSAQTTLKAVYNIGGITGTITFTQQAIGDEVEIVLDLDTVSNGNYTLELHEFRVNYDTVDVCNNDNIGAVIGTASISSGRGMLSATGMDLSGIKSIEGRSFLLRDAADSIRICATIEADADYITAFAHLPAGLGGRVIFRQQDNSPTADTFMYLDLYFVGENTVAAPLNWQINSGIVQMDINANTDLANRCGSTINDMYNPDASTGSGCTTNSHSNCKIGDLTSKHGQLSVSTSGRTRAFFGDLKLPLSGENSIIGKTLAFKNGETYFACANIVLFPRMSAEAKFSREGVTGDITFTQRSPLDITSISANLKNLDSTGGGYHVHNWPVPQQLEKDEMVCGGNEVGGHFNPFNVDVNQNYPSPASTTPEKYEVGDLSGKFGLLNNMSYYNKNMVDPNLQLYGKNTIIGRSLVIHKNQQGAPRWICSTIWPGSDIEMNVAYARFTYPVIGYIVLRQPKEMWYAETQLYIELDYGTKSTVPTTAHNWHVHEKPVGNDMMSATQRCQSVGGHYNPYSVNLAGDYADMCGIKHEHFRCELGDLAGKHGKLNIRKSPSGPQKYFFSDMQLPLSGPQSIVGKSITIHEDNSGSSRLSCADLRLKSPRVVRVSTWSAAQNGGSPTGSITFKQDALDLMSGMTKIKVELSGLAAVGAYHVHEFPTSSKTRAADLCQPIDVGGHLNPFSALYPLPAGETEDKYEIGDLSGKHNMLSGGSYSADNIIDMSLPLEGPYSIVGRSIVIHKTSTGAPRWACGNLEDVTPGSKKLEAMATFTGDVSGYIYLAQYKYANGDMSNTYIVVHLSHSDNSITTGHNWHVHEIQKTSDCASCGPHYNPYDVDMVKYAEECSMSNPLRCEVGDQASKMGQYDIGSGKKFYTDVNLNLEGAISAAKRSIVVHGSNGAGERIACANIVPYGDSMKTYELSFLRVDYTSDDVERKVAASLATSIDNVLVVTKSQTMDCDTVTIYFLGDDKGTLRDQFSDVIRSNNHNILGDFAPSASCVTGKAGNGTTPAPVTGKKETNASCLPAISILALLVCLCVSKLNIWS